MSVIRTAHNPVTMVALTLVLPLFLLLLCLCLCFALLYSVHKHQNKKENEKRQMLLLQMCFFSLSVNSIEFLKKEYNSSIVAYLHRRY